MEVLHINSYYGSSTFYKNLYDIQTQTLSITVAIPTRVPLVQMGLAFGDYAFPVALPRSRNPLRFTATHLAAYSEFRRRVEARRPDIIHAHSLFSNGIFAWWLSRDYGIPYVVAVRNTDLNMFWKMAPFLRSTARTILANAAAVVFIGPGYLNQLMELLDNDLRAHLKNCALVIPNGLSQFWMSRVASPRARPSDSSPLRFVFVGTVCSNKNLLETVRRISADPFCRERGWSFSVVGPVASQRVADRLSRAPNVQLLGRLDEPTILRTLRASDIFIMLSRTETFGLAYLEAMSQGLPVLYTKGQGFDGQLPDGCVGYGVDLAKDRSLQSKPERIMDDYEGMSARAVVGVSRFHWDNIAKRYESLYSDCTSSRGVNVPTMDSAETEAIEG